MQNEAAGSWIMEMQAVVFFAPRVILRARIHHVTVPNLVVIETIGRGMPRSTLIVYGNIKAPP